MPTLLDDTMHYNTLTPGDAPTTTRSVTLQSQFAAQTPAAGCGRRGVAWQDAGVWHKRPLWNNGEEDGFRVYQFNRLQVIFNHRKIF